MKSDKKLAKAFVIEFNQYGNTTEGYIAVGQFKDKVPFNIERVFWTFYTPQNIIRGRHAHFETRQVLVAVSGSIVVSVEYPNGEKESFELDKPNVGVYIPPSCWHTMKYSHSAVQLVLASTEFNEEDYIRSYEQFKTVYGNNG